MRLHVRLALLSAVALGCGKKPAPAPEPSPEAVKVETRPAEAKEDPGAWRDKQLAALKLRGDARRAAADELSFLVLEDPAAGPALVEALRDKGTNGGGHTVANQLNSTREAAAVALLKAGPKGEALLREKGLPALREGLADPTPAVREHSAYTLGLLGPLATPVAGDLQKLCTDSDKHVRAAAFDALRAVGVADYVALAKLLTHKDDEVARLAGELIALAPRVPKEAAEPLAAALKSANPNVVRATADALASLGPDAAPAVPELIALLQGLYKDRDPRKPRNEADSGPELAAWNALVKIGAAAVGPVAKLLDAPNSLLLYYALRALGDIGPAAKPVAPAVKKMLQDRFADNALEAAYALLRMGDSEADALALLKRGLASDATGVAAMSVQVVGRAGPPAESLAPAALAKLTAADPLARYAALEMAATLPRAERGKHAAEVGKLLTDDEKVIRQSAARLLTRMGPAAAPAADALGRAVTTETDAGVRELFVSALLAIGPGVKPALPALLPLANDKDVALTTRLNVLAAAAAADPGSAEVAAAALKAAQDPEPAVRAAAAGALVRLDPLPSDALPALVKMAKGDRQNGPRAAALRALAAAGPRAKPVRGDLDALTSNPQLGLALWAKVALAAADGDVSRAAPAVRAALTDRNPALRAAAAEALLVVGPADADRPALLRLVREPSGPARAAVATSLGRIGPAAEVVPHLTRLLDDRDSEVRAAAAEAVGRFGAAAKDAVPKLKGLLRDPLVSPTAQKALEQVQPPSAQGEKE